MSLHLIHRCYHFLSHDITLQISNDLFTREKTDRRFNQPAGVFFWKKFPTEGRIDSC